MDLPGKLDAFFTWQTIMVTLLYCLGVFMITYGVRRIFETAWPAVKTKTWWREVALPFGPIVLGGLWAMVGSYPWPEFLMMHPSLPVLYGSACGLASGWVYTRFRSALTAWAGAGATQGLPPAPSPSTLPPALDAHAAAPETIPTPPPTGEVEGVSVDVDVSAPPTPKP